MNARDERMITPPFAMVTLSTFAYFLTLGALAPTLPRFIEDELGGGSVSVGVGLGAFSIAATILRPFAGRLGDVRNRRLLVVGGSAIVGASVIAYTLVDGIAALVALRVVTGVGEAAMWVGAATAIQDMAPEQRRGEAASYFSVALYGGLAFGPILGETLVRHMGFDAMFAAAGASALVASFLGLWTPSSAPHEPQPFRLLHPAALGPGAILFVGLLPFVGYLTFLPLYGETVGISNVGPLFLVYGILVLCIRIVGARLPDRLGWRRASTLALVALCTAGVLLAAWDAAAGVWIATVALAIGMSLLFPALMSAVVAGVPANERSQAVGTFSLAFDFANGLGPIFLGEVVALSSYRGAFTAAVVIAVAGFALVGRVGAAT